MTFDHLPGTMKVNDISTLVLRGCTQMAIEEMTKCELVCANCHSVRTFLRRTSRDALAADRSMSPKQLLEVAGGYARLN